MYLDARNNQSVVTGCFSACITIYGCHTVGCNIWLGSLCSCVVTWHCCGSVMTTMVLKGCVAEQGYRSSSQSMNAWPFSLWVPLSCTPYSPLCDCWQPTVDFKSPVMMKFRYLPLFISVPFRDSCPLSVGCPHETWLPCRVHLNASVSV